MRAWHRLSSTICKPNLGISRICYYYQSGSILEFLTWCCKSTGSSVVNQVGIDCPLVDLRWNENIRSFGVAFVVVNNTYCYCLKSVIYHFLPSDHWQLTYLKRQSYGPPYNSIVALHLSMILRLSSGDGLELALNTILIFLQKILLPVEFSGTSASSLTSSLIFFFISLFNHNLLWFSLSLYGTLSSIHGILTLYLLSFCWIFAAH